MQTTFLISTNADNINNQLTHADERNLFKSIL